MSVKLLSITEKSRSIFEITVKMGHTKKTFDVSIVDKHGVFGIEGLGEAEYIFQISPQESHELLAEIHY